MGADDRENDVLWGLLQLIRDIVIIAAAGGIAKWAWDQHVAAPARRDEEARAAMARERELADLRGEARQWGAKIEALAVDISTRLDEVLVRQRDGEQREALKIAIHRALHATADPFLTLDELRKTIAGAGDAGTEPSEPELRRALIELVGEGVIEQLARDSYFIASDFEADEDA